MPDLEKIRWRLIELVNGLRTFQDPDKNIVFDRNGGKHKMSDMQAKVFAAYARQIERVVEEELPE